MAETRIEHVFNCSEDTYWDTLFFNAEYNERMFKEGLDFPKFVAVSEKQTDTAIDRVFDVVPKLGAMPGPVKKLIGDSFGYQENGHFDRASRVYTLKIIPSKLASKISIGGTITTQPAGEGKIKRILSCKVTAKIFGVGGLLEKQTISDMTTNYDKAAKFTNAYIAEKGL
jgi:hypothetical protein